MPIKRQEEWPESEYPTMKPPTYRKQPGKPKKARRLEHDEVFQPGHTKMRRIYNKNHCKICGKEGHNLRICPNRSSTSQVYK